MARNPLPGAKVTATAVAGFALFIAAIIARNFWLSLVLGISGAIAAACAVFLLRE